MFPRITNRTWWKSLLAIGFVCLLISGFLTVTNPANDLIQTIGAISNWTLACTGIATAWGLYDSSVIRKRHLINQVRNQEEAEARSAISQLNAEGYLRDGSLRGADFQRARLSGVDLKATDANGGNMPAILVNVNLTGADLSSADLRRVNLSGSNLELANMSNTLLQEADLSNCRLLMTNLAGTNLHRANLNGANIAGSIFDEQTILPNGERCNDTVKWSDFGVMELPDFALPRPTIQLPQNNSISLTTEQKDADKKLLQKLWKYINSETMRTINLGIQYRNLSYEFYSEHVYGYLDVRDLPENHFIHDQIESAFGAFEDKLTQFVRQIAVNSDVETIGGKEILIPHYKLPEITGRYFESDEIRIEKEKEYDIDLQMLGELLIQHGLLVKTIKTVIPDGLEDITS